MNHFAVLLFCALVSVTMSNPQYYGDRDRGRAPVGNVGYYPGGTAPADNREIIGPGRLGSDGRDQGTAPVGNVGGHYPIGRDPGTAPVGNVGGQYPNGRDPGTAPVGNVGGYGHHGRY